MWTIDLASDHVARCMRFATRCPPCWWAALGGDDVWLWGYLIVESDSPCVREICPCGVHARSGGSREWPTHADLWCVMQRASRARTDTVWTFPTLRS